MSWDRRKEGKLNRAEVRESSIIEISRHLSVLRFVGGGLLKPTPVCAGVMKPQVVPGTRASLESGSRQHSELGPGVHLHQTIYDSQCKKRRRGVVMKQLSASEVYLWVKVEPLYQTFVQLVVGNAQDTG